MKSSSNLQPIASQFQFAGNFLDAQPYGAGHVNGTYRVRCAIPGGAERRYILQRINTNIFREPEALMDNMALVTAHLRQKVIAAGGDPLRNVINLVPTHNGDLLYSTPEGECWRAEIFVEGAETYLAAQSLEHYYNTAFAFGTFQRHLGDFPPERLHITIPDFHHTGKRFEAFVRAVKQDACNRASAVRAEINFALQRAEDATCLVNLAAAGTMPVRVTHNDTKLDNVMIDDHTGQGICVIDLDTVMPGLAVFDFGDTVRSGANPALEDEPDLGKVRFNLAVFERLARGFLDATRDCLASVEIEHLAFGARLITYEQGLRFLTDHLNGDIYYKIHRSNHNLDRCRTQFKLVADMETASEDMQHIIERYSS